MASSVQQLTLSLLIISALSHISNVQSSSRPAALVVPVQKDAATLQYVTTLHQRTPSVPINVVVDLGGHYLWLDCATNYVSSTYTPAKCGSARCSFAGSYFCDNCTDAPPGPGCNADNCYVFLDNDAMIAARNGEVAADALTLNLTDGTNPGKPTTASQFVFACAPSFILQNLGGGAVGTVGLARNKASLTSQSASIFKLKKKFALCLSGSTTVPGALFIGDGPYNFIPGIKTAPLLVFTPLLINPVKIDPMIPNKKENSDEYFIGIKSIRVNGKPIPVNKKLLSIGIDGIGGTKISTMNPYTVLETSIFRAVTGAFTTEATGMNISRVAGVGPFKVCFSSKNVMYTRLGPGVPPIDLVLQSSEVVWTITGSNSVVSVNENVICLGFVDAGFNPRTSIVIGGYQLEDRVLQFDLGSSRLGFTPTLLGSRTTCANFNFTSFI